jgi:hypothetical protein
MKPTIVFFSRSSQNALFPLLASDKYISVHVVMTKEEKCNLEKIGLIVEFCFEEYNKYSSIPDSNYFTTSFVSDRFLKKYSIEDRIKFLTNEIAFWSDVFDTYKPLAVINEQVAIEISEVMYIEAKKRNILYKAWMTSPMNGYFYWLSNSLSLVLNTEIFEDEPSDSAIEESKRYLKRIREDNERPYYLEPFLGKTKIRNIYSSLKNLVISIFREKIIRRNTSQYEVKNSEALCFFERSIKSIYKRYDKIENIQKYEIIVYPLHYEPEASLSYLSEFFSNQVAIIENILKCLSHSQVLVVKEHPAQSGMLLTSKYNRIKKIHSNLFYLSHTVTSYEIIKYSSLIVTLTSHLGWEAVILGKPVFILGNMFYQSYPYINRFVSFEDLRRRIREHEFIYPKEEATTKFIAQLFEISYKGMPFPGTDFLKKENTQNIVSAIEKELNLS